MFAFFIWVVRKSEKTLERESVDVVHGVPLPGKRWSRQYQQLKQGSLGPGIERRRLGGPAEHYGPLLVKVGSTHSTWGKRSILIHLTIKDAWEGHQESLGDFQIGTKSLHQAPESTQGYAKRTKVTELSHYGHCIHTCSIGGLGTSNAMKTTVEAVALVATMDSLTFCPTMEI